MDPTYVNNNHRLLCVARLPAIVTEGGQLEWFSSLNSTNYLGRGPRSGSTRLRRTVSAGRPCGDETTIQLIFNTPLGSGRLCACLDMVRVLRRQPFADDLGYCGPRLRTSLLDKQSHKLQIPSTQAHIPLLGINSSTLSQAAVQPLKCPPYHLSAELVSSIVAKVDKVTYISRQSSQVDIAHRLL